LPAQELALGPAEKRKMKPYPEGEEIKSLILCGKWKQARARLESLAQGGSEPAVLNDLSLLLAREAVELSRRAKEQDGELRIKINHFYLSQLSRLDLSRGENAQERVLELRRGDDELKPRLSIIMRTYNRSDLIAKAIKSVLAQEFSDWELVVVNDGGDRGVEEVLKKLWDKRMVYAYARHSGPAGAFNVGLRLARGELVGFLDDDDIVYPEHFARLVRYLDEHPSCPAVYSDINLVWRDGTGKVVRKKLHQAGEYQPEKLWRGLYIMNLSVLVFRKECLERVPGFIEILTYPQDWEFMLALCREFRPDYLPGAGGELRYWSPTRQIGKLPSAVRNYQRNLILYLYGLGPFYSFWITERQAKKLCPALAEILTRFPELISCLELRKLFSEPAYALFYQLGKELEKEGKKERARFCFKSALKLAPYEIKIWMKFLETRLPLFMSGKNLAKK